MNIIDRRTNLTCTRTKPLVTGYRANQSTRRASLSANLSCNGFSPSTTGALSKGWRVCTAYMPDYWYDRTWAVYEKIVRLDLRRSSTVSQAQERDGQTVRLRSSHVSTNTNMKLKSAFLCLRMDLKSSSSRPGGIVQPVRRVSLPLLIVNLADITTTSSLALSLLALNQCLELRLP